MKEKQPNALINESSPYLLQHAYNPVAWQAWHADVLQKAAKEKKLLLVSIGYAACHWCHVMEKECFEDAEVAEVMNAHFVPVKVDREERPDIDHIYMDALQLMTGGGGWPLNIVALPDGRPFWGATYVKKADWIRVLNQLAGIYRDSPEKVEGYATDLTGGIKAINLLPQPTGPDFPSLQQLDSLVDEWTTFFDTFLGGYKRAPKFMMPVNLDFFLHYASHKGRKDLIDYVNTTLTRMAYGGIYDHIGGGFSRYSVDIKWHVPHFEKMLYDNGQLISLYAKAYANSGNELYKVVAEESIAFVKEELMSPDFGFYSSLDADSAAPGGQLKEGAFYVWTIEELRQLLGADYEVFKGYYNINEYGHWEEGNYVLIRDESAENIAKNFGMSLKELRKKLSRCRALLRKHRARRMKPRLDTKILASWNGLMLQGLIDAYRYLGNKAYLDLALKNADYICTELGGRHSSLYHRRGKGDSAINGYLEDYATIIQALLGLYQVTFNTAWLERGKAFADYCIEFFHDAESGMFFFNSKDEPVLVRRTLETGDNVIPASNSTMAGNLFVLAHYYPEAGYMALADRMLLAISEPVVKHFQSHANWMRLLLLRQAPFYEVVVIGPEAGIRASQMQSVYLPNAIFAGGETEGQLWLTQNRAVPGKTLVYVCEQGSCKLPVDNVREALSLISVKS